MAAPAPDQLPGWGYTGGGAAIALWFARAVYRFQRDLTDRYASEVKHLAADRDRWQRRAVHVAALLAINGIQPPDWSREDPEAPQAG